MLSQLFRFLLTFLETMLARLCCLGIGLVLFDFGLPAAVIPKGADVEVRLLTPVGSRSKVGDLLQASIISPVAANDSGLSLQGCTVLGTIQEVHAVGLGFRHAVATLTIRFHSLRLPNGREFTFNAHVVEVETAREHVRSNGQIVGIDPAANLSAGFSFLMSTLLVHTELEVPAFVVKLLMARSPNSEITLPVGTELFIRLGSDVELDTSDRFNVELPSLLISDSIRIEKALGNLPSQRSQFLSHQWADLVNVALLGTDAEIRDAFAAAGWSGESRHSPLALYRFFHALVQRKGFPLAPMTVLMLNGRSANATFQKGLNTISKRHHIRLWRQSVSDIWFGAAIEDVGLTLSQMHITHATAQDIDNERAKVINDLWSAGCVQEAGYITRDTSQVSVQFPDSIRTDRKLAVLRLSDCTHPVKFADPKPSSVERLLLRACIAGFVDVVRSNPVTVALVSAHTLKVALGRGQSESGPAQPLSTRASILDQVKTRNTRSRGEEVGWDQQVTPSHLPSVVGTTHLPN